MGIEIREGFPVTPEMQEEMRKLIDAARSAVADLQAAAPQPAPRDPDRKRQADALVAIAKSLGAMQLTLQSLQMDVRNLLEIVKNRGAQ